MTERQRIHDLIDRIARIDAADDWTDNLNPTQWTALTYLGRANRFSRSPSQMAEYMATTRGTASQTLKSLARKGLIKEVRSEADRRWISYDLTESGTRSLRRCTAIDEATGTLTASEIDTLTNALESLIRGALEARSKRSFGQCRTCCHHEPRRNGGYCTLLNEDLLPAEADQICHEHLDAA